MMGVTMAGRTDRGLMRPKNEDSWRGDSALGLVAVADGVGGAPAGDVASRLAIDSLFEFLSDAGNRDDPDGGMARAVLHANDVVLERASRDPARAGMSTTLTALRIEAGTGPDSARYLLGHVGDSRAYLFRDGRLDAITRDHTPLQKKIDAGELTREEARSHPWNNLLTQAIGSQPGVVPQATSGSARPGDLFLLCTDGLEAGLTEAAIETILIESVREASDPAADPGTDPAADPSVHGSTGRDELKGLLEGIVDRLVRATLDAGAPDNVAVALVSPGRPRAEGNARDRGGDAAG